ncbi:hypothetical protein ACOSP7_021872 [Xanthoceras sorbifolium]
MFCDACQIGKMHKLPFARLNISAKTPLELVYSDIWGPSPIISTEGFRYYIVFIYAYSWFSWCFPLKLKSKALQTFLLFKKSVEVQLGAVIKCLQTDMGGEYLSFIKPLAFLGIKLQFSCPYMHQQNGVPERKHRHIAELGLTLLSHAFMPIKFWCEAFLTATFINNNLPSSVLKFMSPFEKLFHKKPSYNFFKTFGCTCFPYLRYHSKHKLDFHSHKCLFIGYSPCHKGYKCLSPNGKVSSLVM